jgi:hypothetical protein
MRFIRFWLLSLFFPLPAFSDAVLDWNEVAAKAIVADRIGPPEGARIMAMMHMAMYDAIKDARGESPEAASAAAARIVLDEAIPQQKQLWASLATQPSAAGERAARRCLDLRAKDGVGAPNHYRPVTTPGKYVPTMLPISYDWQTVKPWFLTSPSQFRPEPPPALTSATWARDYNEIKQYGGKVSKRSDFQTETARFWSIVGISSWNSIVRSLAASQPRSLIDNARLFAQVNIAATDAFVAVFDAKYAHQFWRPVTAIRNGDIDGNDATEIDPTWEPHLPTPMHPEYPCAHCITASAVATVLESEFGTGEVAPMIATSTAVPGVTHRWTRIRDYADEVSNARVWGGMHYRTSAEVGQRMGREIGMLAVKGIPK